MCMCVCACARASIYSDMVARKTLGVVLQIELLSTMRGLVFCGSETTDLVMVKNMKYQGNGKQCHFPLIFYLYAFFGF